MEVNPCSMQASSPAKKMGILITNTTILQSSLSVSNPLYNTLAPLTIFDRAAVASHFECLYAHRPPLPSNEEIIAGLVKVLDHYPHFCGRLLVSEVNRPCILLNNAGIRLTEASVSGTLDENLPFELQSNLHELHGPLKGIDELLQIQLNRFECGGLVVGMTNHHLVCDGPSIMDFYASWAQTVGDPNFAPTVHIDRMSVIVARDPPNPTFNHREIEFRGDPKNCDLVISRPNLENLVVHFSEFIDKIKSLVPQRSSKFECLLAHLWKKITIARGLDDEASTEIKIAVNGRGRMKPAVPEGYLGNLVLWAFPKLKVKELKDASYADVVATIHDAISKVDAKYFQSFVDFGKIAEDNMEILVRTPADSGEAVCTNLMVDSWLRFDMEELNFGSGAPCAMFPPNIHVDGAMFFIPSSTQKGRIDVVLALSADHVPKFRKLVYKV